jgi:hypothetical protein
MASNPPDNDKEQDGYENSLQAEIDKLHAYRQSIEEEFKGVDPQDPEASEKARKKIFELIPDAGGTIQYLLLHADSEAVRSSLAKFIFTEAIRSAKAAGDDDALTKLFSELAGNDKEVTI